MRSTCRLVYCIVRRWWMSIDTHLVCNGHCQYWLSDWPQWRGVCHTDRLPGGHSGPAGCSKNWTRKGTKGPILWGFPRPLWAPSPPLLILINLVYTGAGRYSWLVISPKGFYSEQFLFRKVVFPIGFYSVRFLLRKFEIKTFRNKTIRHSKK